MYQLWPLEIDYKKIYLFYTTASLPGEKLVLRVGFYLDFLQMIIQNDYDDSGNSRFSKGDHAHNR